MKQKFPIIVNILVTLTIILLLVFTIFNSFPLDSYVPVHKKWFMYGKVMPPEDYNENIVRDLDIDLIAPKENAKDGDFYWLQTSGDLITLTNRNFRDVKGTLSFLLDVDPCGTERVIYVGTQDGSMEVQTLKSKQAIVEIEFQLSSNSTEFLSIIGSPAKPCKINEDINRSFLAKVTEMKVLNLKIND